VHVDDAIDAVVGFLHLHEVDDRAEVIAEMQIAGRLDARKDPFNEWHGKLSWKVPAVVSNSGAAPSRAIRSSCAPGSG
jgi:hypothetical protein